MQCFRQPEQVSQQSEINHCQTNPQEGKLRWTCQYQTLILMKQSNLRFMSKLLQQITDSRCTEHANTNNLFSALQSACQKHYSTETALVKIHNDLITNIDNGLVRLSLVLLDLSSAFASGRLPQRVGEKCHNSLPKQQEAISRTIPCNNPEQWLC